MIICMNMYSRTSQLRSPVCGPRYSGPNCEVNLILNIKVHKVRTTVQWNEQTGGLREMAFKSGPT